MEFSRLTQFCFIFTSIYLANSFTLSPRDRRIFHVPGLESNLILGSTRIRDDDLDAPPERFIPETGLSISDQIEHGRQEVFQTDLIPLDGHVGVAQLVSKPTGLTSFEPNRYLVTLSSVASTDVANSTTAGSSTGNRSSKDSRYCLVDIPPYSDDLVHRMKAFMGKNHTLVAILVTSSESIHHDQSSTVFAARRVALKKWVAAFPTAAVITSRLDTPRDCRDFVTQKLDGNGPFAWNDASGLFTETSHPLTAQEWDFETAQKIFNGEIDPDEIEAEVEEDPEYTDAKIRQREEGKLILAVCTPGHTFGSLSFVFPQSRLCCSGFTLPMEIDDGGGDDDEQSLYPTMDARGYVTTSRAGIRKQMESARKLVSHYIDRFDSVLPARGAAVQLIGAVGIRNETLLGIIDKYDKIGQLYDTLGITSSGDQDPY